MVLAPQRRAQTATQPRTRPVPTTTFNHTRRHPPPHLYLPLRRPPSTYSSTHHPPTLLFTTTAHLSIPTRWLRGFRPRRTSCRTLFSSSSIHTEAVCNTTPTLPPTPVLRRLRTFRPRKYHTTWELIRASCALRSAPCTSPLP